MAKLVDVTGSTKQTIYGDFGSKQGLYFECFDHYRDVIVQPAINPLMSGATIAKPDQELSRITEYFETQISLAEQMGMPGPGCLVGNAMTETAPTSLEVQMLVEQHNERLCAAFAKALPAGLESIKRKELSEFLTVVAQGLWAQSRVVSNANELRAKAATIVRLVEKEILDDR